MQPNTLSFLVCASTCGGTRDDNSHNGLVRAEYVGCSIALFKPKSQI